MPIIQWAEFAPDLARVNPSFSSNIVGVEPTAAGGYRPVASWQAYGDALPSECLGAITVRKSDGTVSIYAGTATKLYVWAAQTGTWTDVSRLVGGDYSLNDGDYWSFHVWGTYLIAVNGRDDNQYINFDTGGNFAALPNSPKAFYVTGAGDFLVLGKLASNPRKIAWSAVNDPEFWTAGLRGSDEQEMPDGGEVKGLVGHQNGAFIIQEDKIRSMVRIDGPYVFMIEMVHETIGAFSPWSIISTRDTFFWYSQQGFMMGPEARQIGTDKVDGYVRENVSVAKRKRIRGAPDPKRNMVWFLCEASTGTNFMVGYDYILDRWTRVDANLTYLMPAIVPSISYDDAGALGYTYDTVPYQYDSDFWQGNGIKTMAGFNSSGSFGFFEGANYKAVLETNDIAMGKDRYFTLSYAELIGDAGVSDITMYGKHRMRYGHNPSFGVGVSPNAENGRAWFNMYGRLHRVKVEIAEGASWRNTVGIHYSGIESGDTTS